MLPPSAVLPEASGAQTHKIGISMRVAQLKPLMDSLGIPTELRNKQSPKDELPEFSQQLHREKKNQPPPLPSQEYPAGIMGMGCARTFCSFKARPSKIQAFYHFSITFVLYKKLRVRNSRFGTQGLPHTFVSHPCSVQTSLTVLNVISFNGLVCCFFFFSQFL